MRARIIGIIGVTPVGFSYKNNHVVPVLSVSTFIDKVKLFIWNANAAQLTLIFTDFLINKTMLQVF